MQQQQQLLHQVHRMQQQLEQQVLQLSASSWPVKSRWNGFFLLLPMLLLLLLEAAAAGKPK